MKKIALFVWMNVLFAYHPGPYMDSHEGLSVNSPLCGACASQFSLNHETDYWMLYNPCVMEGEIINGYRPAWAYEQKNSLYVRDLEDDLIEDQDQWPVSPMLDCKC